MAREDPHFRLRLSEELHGRVRVAAAINRRSITAEVVARLEESFSREALPGEPVPSAELRVAVREAVAAMLDQIRADPAALLALFPTEMKTKRRRSRKEPLPEPT